MADSYVPVKDAIGNVENIDNITVTTGAGGVYRQRVTLDTADPIGSYKIADEDSSGTTKYYGFTKLDGTWLVMAIAKAAQPYTYRYANVGKNGTINAGAAVSYGNAVTTHEPWTNRATLTYDYLFNLTGV